MNRRRARWIRTAVTGALAWERGIRDGGRRPGFPFHLGRTEVERALLHKILVSRWNHLVRVGPEALLIEALDDLRRIYRLTRARQSIESAPVFECLLDSFQYELDFTLASAAG